MATEIKGQETETPPVETKPGQEKVSDSPPENLTEKIVKAAKVEEAAASEKKEKKEEKKEEKPPPYDQDPKWKKARAAEARVEKILSSHKLKNIDALEEILDRGMTISEVLGERDAKKLIEDYETLKGWKEKVESYWEEQERKKLEEEETPDETIARLKKEQESHKKQTQAKEQQAKEATALKKAVDDYGKHIDDIVDQQGFDKEEAQMAKLLLGVDNPFNEVDIYDKVAVKKMAKENAAKFKTFLDSIRQSAIDEYAKGKSKIIPISSTESPAKESVSKKKLPDNATVDQVFDSAKDELLEFFKGGLSP